MKAFLTSFNSVHGVNPMVSWTLDALPGFQRATAEDCEVVFLSFICPANDFTLDAESLKVIVDRKAPVIIFDHTETFAPDFFLGATPIPESSPYKPLSEAVRQLPIKAYFKRELSPDKGSFPGVPVHPIDWTLKVINCGGPVELDTVEAYNARPIDIFFSWGYSCESRPKLMGELLRRAGEFSAHFCLTEDDLDRALQEKRERIFALLFTPHFRRIHISKIIEWQAKAKISVSMFGAGKKCFRHAESSYNCLMAQQAPDTVQWSYPWVAGENCLQLPEGEKFVQDHWRKEEEVAVDWLYQALRMEQGKLHPVYVNCVLNNRNYHNNTYAREWLLPKIQKALA